MIRNEQASLTDLLHQRERQCLPQISQIYADKQQNSKQHEQHISTVWYLSLSARSAASALVDPFNQPVFRLRESAKSAGE